MPTTSETHIGLKTLTVAARVAADAVFTTMLGMTIEPADPYEEAEPKPYDGVVGLVTFTGRWIGAGMFCCNEELACEIGAAMLGHPVEKVDYGVLDGIGEMANMIVGNLKQQLEGRTGPLALGIPTVVYGKNFSARTAIKAPWSTQPFRVGERIVEVRCCVRPA